MSLSIRAVTKNVLAESLIELTETKNIEKITIQDIVENCGTGRQTFYNHFTDKFDLINWVYKKNADDIFKIFTSDNSLHESIAKMCLLFLSKKKFFLRVYKMTDKYSFTNYLFEYTKDFYINSIANQFGKEEITDDLIYTIEFYSYGGVNMFKAWVLDGMKTSPEYMANMFFRNMPNDLRKYYI